MKLTYVANVRMPTEKAHGIQIMEMCQALSLKGADVTLLVRGGQTDITEDPFKFYDIRSVFALKRLWCLDTARFGRLGFLLQSLTFSLSALLYSLNKRNIFYTRDAMVAVCLKVVGKKVIWEAHMGHKNFLIRIFISMGGEMVVITRALKDLYKGFGLSHEKVLVAPDGVDIDRFDINIGQRESRNRLGLPLDKKIVLYKGSLIQYKGVDVLAKSAAYLKDTNVQIVVVGGVGRTLEAFRNQYGAAKNLTIIGQVLRAETPVYQKAADVLVIPNSAKDEMSRLYTSPMKLFGYMASKVPIIASDLPSLREIVDESLAYFCKPDDPADMARAIDNVLAEPEKAQKKAQKAFMKARQFSWDNRAKDVISFIGKAYPQS